MTKLNFGILCETSIISKDGIPSFISIFSQIIVEKLPFIRQEIHVITNYSVEESEKKNIGELEVILKSPSEKILSSLKSKILPRSEKEENEIGFISVFKNIKFEEDGKYSFEVLVNGKKIGTIPLSILVKK